MKHKYDGTWKLEDGRVVRVVWDGGGYTFREVSATRHYAELDLGHTRAVLNNAERVVE
jgi:hypothetical protein